MIFFLWQKLAIKKLHKKSKFSNENIFDNYKQIHMKLLIWLHLLITFFVVSFKWPIEIIASFFVNQSVLYQCNYSTLTPLLNFYTKWVPAKNYPLKENFVIHQMCNFTVQFHEALLTCVISHKKNVKFVTVLLAPLFRKTVWYEKWIHLC